MKINDSSFIVEKNVLTRKNCKNIIDFFESNPKCHKKGKIGTIGSGVVDSERKSSTDMYLTFDVKNAKCGEEKINLELLKSVCDASSEFKEIYPQTNNLDQWQIDPNYNIQKYEPGEGYFLEHCENDNKNSPRVLVWMLYLNDLDDGGTHFPYQNKTLKAEQGKCVIWPAYFTHMHFGQVSYTQTKYIATGWFIYSDPPKD